MTHAWKEPTRLEERLRELADELEDGCVPVDLPDLRRAADALEAARELLRADAEELPYPPRYHAGVGDIAGPCLWCGLKSWEEELGNPQPHAPTCPWRRLRDLLGEDG